MKSKIENKLAGELDRRKIDYKRNVIIKKERRAFELDFYIEREKFSLNVEADGSWYHLNQPKDQQRDEILKTMGIDVIRFTGSEIWDDVKRCGLVVQKYINEHGR